MNERLDDGYGVAEAALRDAIAATALTIERGMDSVLQASAAIRQTLARDGKVLVFGNGGSAAEAQHFAAELVGRFARDRRPMAAIALTTDTSILTAVSNDRSFDHVFARQVEALGRPGDVAVGISTSGQSQNVVEGLKVARAGKLTTIGVTGGDGGAVAGLVDVHVNVPHVVTARVQEVQLMLLHVLCELVEREIK
jgi:D-sedoheptulose 7-phosphate isomerase